MNLYLRLIFTLITARFKSRLNPLEEHTTSHRVWLNDIDPLMHMNNGRYFTITDLVRIEKLIRSGVWQAMKQRGFYAVITGETIQFRKSLKTFQKYNIRSRTIGWDEKDFYIEHRFERNETLCALALTRSRLVGKNKPSPAEVFRWVGEEVPDINMTEVIANWNNSAENHWTESVSEHVIN